MADTTTTPKKAPHSANNLVVLILVVLVGLAFVGGWYLGQHKQSPSKQKALTTRSGWASYTDDKYGFGFIYPNSLGKPLVNVKAGTVGNTFHITFPSAKNTDQAVEINMTSDDFKDKICSFDKKTCHDVNNTLNKDYVTNMLNSKSQTIVVQTEDSFAMVVARPDTKQSTLGLDRIVDLKKAKISAASLQLTKNGAENCPQDKFVNDSKSKCVVQTDYDTLNSMAQSIQSI
jgi:hypothetical protein